MSQKYHIIGDQLHCVVDGELPEGAVECDAPKIVVSDSDRAKQELEETNGAITGIGERAILQLIEADLFTPNAEDKAVLDKRAAVRTRIK